MLRLQTYFGPLPVLDFKFVNHGEGGSISYHIISDAGFCETSDDILRRKQELLNEKPQRWAPGRACCTARDLSRPPLAA